ncbi:MAG TPA: GDYXXLXY domain-containing protein [Chryseolinea sp.]|nr:GDYXXLXY domain-containing protein [Chryseolinea sp.]
MKTLALPLFVVMCIAQWFVPGKMIYDSETVIVEGVSYKFKTQPIDPSDPFRGKYITLNFDANSIIIPDSADWQSGEDIFITFTIDSAGFSKASGIYRSEPETVAYLKTTVSYFNTYENFEVFYNIPFDRFYLEESKASQAEQLYWQAQRDSAQVAYGLVTIGKGQAVLTDVMINDRSVVDIINELNSKSN